MEFYLLSEEMETLLRWWKNNSQRQSRFGGATYIFPMEDYLLSKLRNHQTDAAFDDMDLEIFIDWMEKALMPHPGQQVLYFPGEESLANHLRQLQREYKQNPITPPEAGKREDAVRTADKLLMEKKNRAER